MMNKRTRAVMLTGMLALISICSGIVSIEAVTNEIFISAGDFSGSVLRIHSQYYYHNTSMQISTYKDAKNLYCTPKLDRNSSLYHIDAKYACKTFKNIHESGIVLLILQYLSNAFNFVLLCCQFIWCFTKKSYKIEIVFSTNSFILKLISLLTWSIHSNTDFLGNCDKGLDIKNKIPRFCAQKGAKMLIGDIVINFIQFSMLIGTICFQLKKLKNSQNTSILPVNNTNSSVCDEPQKGLNTIKL